MSKQISAQKNAEGTNPDVCQLFEIAPFLIEMAFKNYELNTSKTCHHFFLLTLEPKAQTRFLEGTPLKVHSSSFIPEALDPILSEIKLFH